MTTTAREDRKPGPHTGAPLIGPPITPPPKLRRRPGLVVAAVVNAILFAVVGAITAAALIGAVATSAATYGANHANDLAQVQNLAAQVEAHANGQPPPPLRVACRTYVQQGGGTLGFGAIAASDAQQSYATLYVSNLGGFTVVGVDVGEKGLPLRYPRLPA